MRRRLPGHLAQFGGNVAVIADRLRTGLFKPSPAGADMKIGTFPDSEVKEAIKESFPQVLKLRPQERGCVLLAHSAIGFGSTQEKQPFPVFVILETEGPALFHEFEQLYSPFSDLFRTPHRF